MRSTISAANAKVSRSRAVASRKPRDSEIEHVLGVELADGRAVRALHVVGEDLELRLGVDVRLVGQQQVAALLRRSRCAARPGAPRSCR